MTTVDIGQKGEAAAAAYLESCGFVVLERNYRFERAEVDLVCFKASANGRSGEIVFVEVKARTGRGYGRPEAAIDAAKVANIVKASRAWLYEQRMDAAPCRFDVVSVLLTDAEPEFEHFENAFHAA